MKSRTDALPSVAYQPVLDGSFLRRNGARLSFQPRRSARKSLSFLIGLALTSYQHQQLIVLDLRLVLIQTARRWAGDHFGVAVEGSAVAGAAEIVAAVVPVH